MRVLVIGGGGREHALAWRIARSPREPEVLVAPGNAGTALEGGNIRNVDAGDGSPEALLAVAREHGADLTIVGPEAPLAAGVCDLFRDNDLRIFGPSAEAAALESSKVFCKNLLRKHLIPTAEARTVDRPEDAEKVLEAHFEGQGGAIVIKKSGLAAGKGVVVTDDPEEALAAALRFIGPVKEAGYTGEEILIEECLNGEEASVIAFTDGRTVAPLAPAQDHKPVGDNDEGPNTGGMGAVSPAPVVTDEIMELTEREILIPTVHAMRSVGREFQGILYAGLMMTPAGPKVLEYNVRFGDPEAQPLLMRLQSDLLDLVDGVVDGNLADVDLQFDDRAACCVVLCSGGYPGDYPKGVPIEGVADADALPDVKVFHAGTALDDDDTLVTAGGRVLGVTALGVDLREAIDRAYEAAGRIRFDGMHMRTDIGRRSLERAAAGGASP